MRSLSPIPDSSAKKFGKGAAAGIAGTVAIQLAQMAVQKLVPSATEPMRLEPGAVIARKVHNALPAAAWGSVPLGAEKVAAHSLGFGYGMTFGVIYAALRPRGGGLLIDGLIVGLLCWAAGYLGWLPASGLMPPLRRQTPMQIAGPVVTHAIYGLATVGAYELLEENV